MMCDWSYSSHWCLIWRCLHWGITYSSMMILWYGNLCRHILPRVYLALRAYSFWDDAFILGQSHLVDFDIETPLPVYDYCFWWIIESLTPWVQSLQHTWSDLVIHLCYFLFLHGLVLQTCWLSINLWHVEHGISWNKVRLKKL